MQTKNYLLSIIEDNKHFTLKDFDVLSAVTVGNDDFKIYIPTGSMEDVAEVYNLGLISIDTFDMLINDYNFDIFCVVKGDFNIYAKDKVVTTLSGEYKVAYFNGTVIFFIM